MYWTKLETVKQFPSMLVSFYIPPSLSKKFSYPHICQHLWLSNFLPFTILVNVKWRLILIFICISIITNNAKNHMNFSLHFQNLWIIESQVLTFKIGLFSYYKVCIEDNRLWSDVYYKHFLPASGLPFHFLNCDMSKCFHFDKVWLINSFCIVIV